MLIIFSLTLFVSALLMFWVQPMVAKMLLPLLGGAPAVWNTSVFFFQAVLLAGYGYAYLSTRWLNVRHQVILHVGLLLLPLPLLPLTVSGNGLPPGNASPIFWLLTLLLVSVGIPFFVVSTSAPLLQRWFSCTEHPAAKDPYFLYISSNTGSLLGLVGYPILIEPLLPLTQQSWLWSGGYLLFIFLTLACAVCLAGSRRQGVTPPSQIISPDSPAETLLAGQPRFRQQAQWVILSFLPSSLLLGVTTHITTDIASVPFLWAVPLALYLLSFIAMFSGRWTISQPWLVYSLPIPAFMFALPWLYKGADLWAMTLHLVGFFAVSCVLHGVLAKNRPRAEYLTLFYFWVSFGGMLGGLFNSIIAPLTFSTLLEYSLALLMSLVAIQAADQTKLRSLSLVRLAFFVCVGSLLSILIRGVQIDRLLQPWLGVLVALSMTAAIATIYALPRLQWSLCLGLVLMLCQFSASGGQLAQAATGEGGNKVRTQVLVTERSFFGIHRVVAVGHNLHTLIHGTTVHGAQRLESGCKALGYYHPTGPIGQVFQAGLLPPQARIAIMGLGAGGLGSYAQPDQHWSFYEIDPTVKRIAEDPRYFTFLNDCVQNAEVILGDARMMIAGAMDAAYNLIVIDVFSSDAVPVHLLTREALELYLDRLANQGIIAIHISNRYIDLEPVLKALAKDLGLVALRQDDQQISAQEQSEGKLPSHWIVIARQASDLRQLNSDSRWQSVRVARHVRPWTDDFSNLFQALRQ